MQKVFISHSSMDKDFVREVASDLLDYGIDVWLDEWEMLPGDSLIEKVQQGLENSGYVLAMISKNSVSSSWVKSELESALSLEMAKNEKMVIPALIDDSVELPPFLNSRIYVNFRNYDMAIRKLVSKIKGDQFKPKPSSSPKQLSDYVRMSYCWDIFLLDSSGKQNELVFTSKIKVLNPTNQLSLNRLTPGNGEFNFIYCNLTTDIELKNVGGAVSAIANLPKPLIQGREYEVIFKFMLSDTFSENPCSYTQEVNVAVEDGYTVQVHHPKTEDFLKETVSACRRLHGVDTDAAESVRIINQGKTIRLELANPEIGSRYDLEWERVLDN